MMDFNVPAMPSCSRVGRARSCISSLPPRQSTSGKVVCAQGDDRRLFEGTFKDIVAGD
jgi:hypothetical protein